MTKVVVIGGGCAGIAAAVGTQRVPSTLRKCSSSGCSQGGC